MIWLLALACALQLLCMLNAAVEAQHAFRRLHKRIVAMNQEETQAFADLNAKVDTLVTAVGGLTTEIATEKAALDAALAASDTAGVLAAAQALNAKLDAGISAANAALNPPAPPPPAG